MRHLRHTTSLRIVSAAFGICVFVFSAGPFMASAQEARQGVSLSVTPPLIQLSMKPGDFWASTLKVVNTNPYDLTIYTSRMVFGPSGEEGYGHFTPLTGGEADNQLLASWIDISPGPFTIPPGSSEDVPFSIRVPQDAGPGGHYAAVLVGTRSIGSSNEQGSFLNVSSFISSLFFVRIAGDVREVGAIREFSTDRSWYDDPRVQFAIRFENTGNVHLQPKGLVEIHDMWGREVAKIEVNQRGGFGNVLPQSTRKFELAWSTDKNVFAAGRYSAVLTLAYGQDGTQYASQTIVFWVIPVRETGAVLVGLLVFLIGLRFLIRSYVRRALRAHLGEGNEQANGDRVSDGVSREFSSHERDVVDLRKRR